jgi:hypothetical protein
MLMTGRYLIQKTLSIFAVSLILLVLPMPQRAVAQTFHQIQISSNADDGYYNSQDGSGWHSTPQYGPGADLVGSASGLATAWVIGDRFPSTGINSGDTIQSAYLQLFSSDGDASSVTCASAPCPSTTSSFRVYGVAQDDGPSFSGAAGNTPLDVPYTAAYTDYTTTGPGDVQGSCGGRNNGQNTCTHIIDVTAIVREITSRPGWTSASAIRFVFLSTTASGSSIFAGFEDSSANAEEAATLVVNPPLPTVVSSGAWGTSAAGTYPLTYQTGPFVYSGASTLLLFLGDYFTFDSLTVDQPAVTDSCGNTWNILGGPADYVAYFYDMRSTVYYVQNPVACSAGDTITVTTDNQEPIFLHFLAMVGSNTSQAPVVSSITNPGSPGLYTTTATTGPVMLSSSGLLVSWAFGDSDAPHTFTPQTGFITDPNSTPNYLTAVYENVASGTYTNQFSISPSDGWQAVLIGMPAPGGSGSAPPSITSASTASGTVGTSFSYQITATNSPTSYGAPGLPTGLTVNTSSGLISGTPTQSGTFSVTLSAVNGTGTGTAILTLTVTGQTTPSISWSTPAALTYGTALSSTQLDASTSISGTFVYTPAAGTVLSAGTQTLSVTFTPDDTTDYTTATQTVQLVVNQASPTITWPKPSAITYGMALSTTQLSAATSVAGTLAYTPSAGTVLSAGTQTLSVTFSPTDTIDYTTATQTVQLVVNQASPTITWSKPSAITYGTALSTTQLSATASVPGTLAFTPSVGTVLSAGTQTLSVTLTPTDTTDYTTATQTVQLVVNQAAPLITWAAPAPIAYPTALSATQLNATASVPGAFAYNPGTGTVLNTGTQTLSVTFTPTDTTDYSTATQTVQLVVNKAGTPMVTWSTPAAIAYGTALSATQLDATATLPGAFSYNPVAGVVLNAGTQTLSVTFTPSDAAYSAVTQTVQLVVNQASQVISFTLPSSVSSGPITLSATGGPSGNPVTFSVVSGPGTISGNSLAFTATGVVTVAADQAGNSNYLAAPEVTQSVTVTGTSSGASNFTLSISGASSANISQGSTASYQLVASPVDGSYPGTITFSTSGLPAGATATFNPASIPVGGGQQTVTATVQTTQSAATKSVPSVGRRLVPVSLALLLPLLGLRGMRRRYIDRFVLLIVLIGAGAAATTLSGCGGDLTVAEQQSQNYTVTITASGGGLQHSVDVTLTVLQ